MVEAPAVGCVNICHRLGFLSNDNQLLLHCIQCGISRCDVDHRFKAVFVSCGLKQFKTCTLTRFGNRTYNVGAGDLGGGILYFDDKHQGAAGSAVLHADRLKCFGDGSFCTECGIVRRALAQREDVSVALIRCTHQPDNRRNDVVHGHRVAGDVDVLYTM